MMMHGCCKSQRNGWPSFASTLRQDLRCSSPTAVQILAGQRDDIAIQYPTSDEVIEKTWDLFCTLRAAVGTLLCQGLKNIRHSDNARLSGEAVGPATERVAVAV